MSRNDTVFLIYSICENWQSCMEYEIHEIVEMNGFQTLKYFGKFGKFRDVQYKVTFNDEGS